MTSGEQLHRMTEGVYKNILDGFTPEVRHLIAQGKVYDKALQGVTQAAKDYFDAIVKVGEVASDTKGSRTLGQSLLQIAETYRQIEAERDALVHSLRKDLLLPMENKLDQEWKFLSQSQKAYLSENKSRAEAVDKRRSDVKKLQKKTQKSNNEKYLEKEQKSLDDLHQMTKQLLSFRSQSLREAWCEQRKRYAFVVERYCASVKNESAFYGKAQSVLQYRLPKWLDSCETPYKLPEECEEMLSMTTQVLGQAPDGSQDDSSEDFSGPLASPLQMELRNSMRMLHKVLDDGSGSEASQSRPGSIVSQDIERPLSVEVEHPPPASPTDAPPAQPPMAVQPPTVPNQVILQQEQFMQPPQQPTPPPTGYMSATLPGRGRAAGGLRHTQSVAYTGSPGTRHRPQVQRHASESGDNEKVLTKVRALYNHVAAGDTQLSFQEGDVIALVGPQNNGWYFGHHFRTKKNGWFPISFTQPIENGFPQPNGSMQQPQIPHPKQNLQHQQHQPSLGHGRSVSSENLARTNGIGSYPSPDYISNENPHQQKFFGGPTPLPAGHAHSGLLITSSQGSLHSNQDSSSGSQLSTGSPTQQHSSAGGDQPHHPEGVQKPSTPTHAPPPPPGAEGDPNQPSAGATDEAQNPILSVQLRRTVTDDRSAPQIPRDYTLDH